MLWFALLGFGLMIVVFFLAIVILTVFENIH